ncbi:MAG: DUF63 family protein [Candidatus Methanofastidiosia archaeon]
MWPDFIQKYFIDPIVEGGGYNIVNTLTYGVILVVASYLIFKFLKPRLSLDRRFLKAICSFVLVGSSLRVLNDAGVTDTYLLVTPLIYFLTFAITAIALPLSLRLSEMHYHRYMMGVSVGIFLISFSLLILNTQRFHIDALILIISGVLISFLLVFIIAKLLGLDFISQNLWIMAGHLLDASATSFGIQRFGYYEQHVVPNLFIDLTGTPFVMFPLKIFIVGVILYLLKDTEDDDFKNFMLMVIFILGAAPGLRDTLRIVFGV